MAESHFVRLRCVSASQSHLKGSGFILNGVWKWLVTEIQGHVAVATQRMPFKASKTAS